MARASTDALNEIEANDTYTCHQSRSTVDIDTDCHHLELLRRGAGSKLAELAPEAIQASGDHELLNWIIALGILGDIPAEIVDVRESHTQLAFRVAAIWE